MATTTKSITGIPLGDATQGSPRIDVNMTLTPAQATTVNKLFAGMVEAGTQYAGRAPVQQFEAILYLIDSLTAA
jgi:hypothetical protein